MVFINQNRCLKTISIILSNHYFMGIQNCLENTYFDKIKLLNIIVYLGNRYIVYIDFQFTFRTTNSKNY